MNRVLPHGDHLAHGALRNYAFGKPAPMDSFYSFENPRSGDDKPSTLATLFRPPLELSFKGSFNEARAAAVKANKWLIVNVQSLDEFASFLLNRDTWSHEVVKDTIGSVFIFWQIYDHTDEGKMVCSYYGLVNQPSILVLNPLSKQLMKSWVGMIGPQPLLEDLEKFMVTWPEVTDSEGTSELQALLKQDVEELPPKVVRHPDEYPPLPSEPAIDSATCRVGVWFPDGTCGHRRYHRYDPASVLWTYCCKHVAEAGAGRSFRLNRLDYDPDITIDGAGLANKMLVMVWD